MVTFTCNACGDSVKKDKVDTHYRTKCPECNEAEKYQGALYKPKDKANKGDLKQQAWLTNVHAASSSIEDPKMKSALEKISKYQNIPRKQKKFINFAKNSLKIYDEIFLGKLFGHFSGNADVAEEAPKMSAKVAENVATAALPSLISELKGAATTASSDDKKRKRDTEDTSNGDVDKKSKKEKKKNSDESAPSDADASKKKKDKKSKKDKKKENGKADKDESNKEKKDKKSKKSKKSKKESK